MSEEKEGRKARGVKPSSLVEGKDGREREKEEGGEGGREGGEGRRAGGSVLLFSLFLVSSSICFFPDDSCF